MLYREIKPSYPLGRFVECFWTLKNSVPAEPSRPERILPDGCVEIVLNFGSSFAEHKDNGVEERQPQHFLVGQMTKPMVIVPTGTVDLLGIRFHPGGTIPFFRMPMHEVSNQVIDLELLSNSLRRDLIDQPADTTSSRQRIALVEKLLVERVRDCKHDSWLIGLAARVVRCGGVTPVDQLAADAGISSRQLERRFLRDVGIGPKLLCRILRFQQVLCALDAKDARWTKIAVDCGYYDQAHLIRDFQQFARQTPSILSSHSSELTVFFSRKGRTSDFSNTQD